MAFICDLSAIWGLIVGGLVLIRRGLWLDLALQRENTGCEVAIRKVEKPGAFQPIPYYFSA